MSLCNSRKLHFHILRLGCHAVAKGRKYTNEIEVPKERGGREGVPSKWWGLREGVPAWESGRTGMLIFSVKCLFWSKKLVVAVIYPYCPLARTSLMILLIFLLLIDAIPCLIICILSFMIDNVIFCLVLSMPNFMTKMIV